MRCMVEILCCSLIVIDFKTWRAVKKCVNWYERQLKQEKPKDKNDRNDQVEPGNLDEEFEAAGHGDLII